MGTLEAGRENIKKAIAVRRLIGVQRIIDALLRSRQDAKFWVKVCEKFEKNGLKLAAIEEQKNESI